MATNGTTNGHHATNGSGHGPIVASGDEFLSHDYDFVIAGGGTAALTIAARLTENPDIKVGVIEAGKHRKDDPLVDTPAAFTQMLGNAEYDWIFKTVPQEGNKNVEHHMVRGKMLGGSSGINYMMYVRGDTADYDDFAALAGDEGWNAENMMKYMRKHQTLEPLDPATESITPQATETKNHGTNGPVRTSFNTTPPMPIETAMAQACDEVSGYSKKPTDAWSGDHIGFYNTLGSVARTGPDKGKRSYAGRGYFGLAAERPNFHVICEAFVNKVNLEGNRAVGVNFTHNGKAYDVPARAEVIVACGAIQSPQVLELSGIGDPEVLRGAGVEPKIENAAVGNNFQEHVLTLAIFELKPGVLSADVMYQPGVLEDAQKTLMESQSGPLTGISPMQGFWPYKTCATAEQQQKTISSIRDSIKKAKTDFERKQLEQVIAHLESDTSANLQLVMVPATGNKDGVTDQSKLFAPPADLSTPFGMSVALCLQYPASRGSVHIQSSDPRKAPLIDPAYLKHPADAWVLASGLQFVDKVTESKHIAPMLAKRTVPAADVNIQNFGEAEESVRDWVMGEYHPCGSVAMGAALDSRLKVNGVEGLRVADASAFPNNVSGNICSTVYALAEKAADLIKEDWDRSK